MNRTATQTRALLGAAFGCCFPVMATGIRVFQNGAEGAIAAISTDPLLWIIFTAPVFLGAFAALGGRKQDEVSALNDGLEQTVADRTRELATALTDLESARASESALLASLEVGLVSFDRTGALSTGRSAALSELLTGSEEEDHIDQLLQKYADIPVETTAMVRDLLWDDVFWSPFDDTVALITRRFSVGEKVLATSFRAVHNDDDTLQKVLVQVVDCTAEARAETSHAEAKARIERLSMAARSRSAFQRFRHETDGLFNVIGQHAGPEHARPLHTLKGIARIFAFHDVARLLHDIEDRVQAGERPAMEEVVQRFTNQADDVAMVLGIADEETRLSVDRAGFQAVMDSAEPHTAGRLRALTQKPAEEMLRHHAEAAERPANHKDLAVQVHVTGSSLFDDELSLFDTALTHVLTNAVTHACRSESVLNVEVRVQRAERLRIRVQDDGGGIDRDRLVGKAVQLGFWSTSDAERATDDQVLALVFESGLSTKDQVTDAAGRGVGLAAARADLRHHGGDLRLVAPPGHGATFILEGPEEDLFAQAV